MKRLLLIPLAALMIGFLPDMASASTRWFFGLNLGGWGLNSASFGYGHGGWGRGGSSFAVSLAFPQTYYAPAPAYYAAPVAYAPAPYYAPAYAPVYPSYYCAPAYAFSYGCYGGPYYRGGYGGRYNYWRGGGGGRFYIQGGGGYHYGH
jgi:hypothetical protein